MILDPTPGDMYPPRLAPNFDGRWCVTCQEYAGAPRTGLCPSCEDVAEQLGRRCG